MQLSTKTAFLVVFDETPVIKKQTEVRLRSSTKGAKLLKIAANAHDEILNLASYLCAAHSSKEVLDELLNEMTALIGDKNSHCAVSEKVQSFDEFTHKYDLTNPTYAVSSSIFFARNGADGQSCGIRQFFKSKNKTQTFLVTIYWALFQMYGRETLMKAFDEAKRSLGIN